MVHSYSIGIDLVPCYIYEKLTNSLLAFQCTTVYIAVQHDAGEHKEKVVKRSCEHAHYVVYAGHQGPELSHTYLINYLTIT